MSSMKQRQKLKLFNRWKNSEDTSYVNPNMKVHARDVHHLHHTSSHVSKSIRCKLPEIGNGQLVTQHTGNNKPSSCGKVVPTEFPPIPVRAAAQQQIKVLSKRSSTSSLGLDSQHPHLNRHDFQEQKHLMFPAVAIQGCGYKESRQLKQDRPMPVRLPPIENMTQKSSRSAWSAAQKPKIAALEPTMVLNSTRKLPDIKNTSVRSSRPKSGNLHRVLSVLPPTSGRTEEPEKNHKLPPRANMQRAVSPTADKTK